MKKTFTFLTILLIFTSQVFGQVKTINKDGKAIILNDDVYSTESGFFVTFGEYI